MLMKIFYSWQSDLPNKCNRGFVEDCIKRTIKKYKDTITIDADRDVQNNTGSPDIANTIFDKIDECDLFIADISIIAIKNVSPNLDRNINITITVEGSDIELVAPTEDLINGELQGNAGFVCDFGFILNAFCMEETPEIKFDELELYDYYDDNPYINLWDGCTTFDSDDFVNVLCDYIATPITANVVEFKISSLQANETKWLNKVILLRAGSDDIKLKYSIKSDNTDGSVSGTIS